MSKKNEIRLLRVNYLRGPNVWTYRAVLESWIDIGELEDHPSHQLPGFNARLRAWLPALEEHHCGVGERGGFLQRLQEGTWMGHVLEHVVIELLNLAGMPTGFGQTRSTSTRGVYRMVFRARDERVARTALDQGLRLLMAAINDEPADVTAAVAAVREQLDECYLGPSTAAIVAAATERGIPHLRLNAGNLVQLGHGARQRRIWTAETERTSAIGEAIASDKDLTKGLLKAVGVPVPEGRIVATPAEAWEAAEDMGVPVVVKPSDGNHGRGVTLDLRGREEIEAAWVVADRHGSEVMVERHIPGHEHRLLVVGGKLVAAARGEIASVIGDGSACVADLVDAQINTDPRRGLTEDHPLNRLDPREDGVILLDLQRQGLTPDSVPTAGQRVLIQRNGNVAIECTDEVHPEVAHAVTLAARVVGLDVAGIDVVAEDIGRPLQEQGGAIVEVNAGPGLLPHLKPAVGSPRPVGRAIVDHLFPEVEGDAATGRIPIIGVAGSDGASTVARVVAWLMQLSGQAVGVACREGLFFDRRLVESGDCTGFEFGRRLLMNRRIETAVFESSAATILREGLAYDRCHVGVVTDLGGAGGLSDFDIETSDQLLKVLRTQVDVVLPDGVAVLNAADERVAGLAPLSDGEVLYYALDGTLPAMAAHREAGGRVVFVRDDRTVLAQGAAETQLPDVARLPRRGGARVAPQTLLAVVAAAWAIGVSPDLMVAGIETFDPSPDPAPGR